MTAEAKHFIEQFATLPDLSKHEVLAELLRACTDFDYAEMGDEELLYTSNQMFAAYEERQRNEFPG